MSSIKYKNNTQLLPGLPILSIVTLQTLIDNRQLRDKVINKKLRLGKKNSPLLYA